MVVFSVTLVACTLGNFGDEVRQPRRQRQRCEYASCRGKCHVGESWISVSFMVSLDRCLVVMIITSAVVPNCMYKPSPTCPWPYDMEVVKPFMVICGFHMISSFIIIITSGLFERHDDAGRQLSSRIPRLEARTWRFRKTEDAPVSLLGLLAWWPVFHVAVPRNPEGQSYVVPCRNQAASDEHLFLPNIF